MKRFQYIPFLLLCFWAIASCKKEYSYEEGSNVKGVIIGNNCIIKKIIEYDTVGKKNVGVLQYDYNTTGTQFLKATQIDSLTLNTLFGETTTYIQDSIALSANQYFIKDASGKIIKFAGYEDPYDNTSFFFINKYIYDNNGKLTTKNTTTPALPNTIGFQTTYTYSGNNITNIVKKLPLLNATETEITIEYYTGSQPKNFINFLPDCNELRTYIAALDMGQKPDNTVKKVTKKEYDIFLGTLLSTSVTEFSRYTFSSDGYILSVDMSGNILAALPFETGRNKFEYFCKP
jgi:hypothetical protein